MTAAWKDLARHPVDVAAIAAYDAGVNRAVTWNRGRERREKRAGSPWQQRANARRKRRKS